MNHQVVMWGVFNLLVAVMLYIDLAVAQKRSHAIGLKESAIWSLVWVVVSVLFGGAFISTSRLKSPCSSSRDS